MGCCLLCILCYCISAFSELQVQIADRIYQHPKLLEGNICIIGIDSKSLDELGPFSTWTRGDMAKALEILNKDSEARPSVIGVDVMYYGNTEPKEDNKLVGICSQYDNIVMASSFIFQSTYEEIHNNSYKKNPYGVSMLEEPFPDLKEVTMQGHVNTMTDEDGVVRHHMYQVPLPDGRVIKSFSGKLYEHYSKVHSLPIKEPILDQSNQWYIPYIGKPGAYYDYFSFSDLLSGELTGDMFDDCVVIIGAYAPGLMDSYKTSIDHTSLMYGAEIHANVLDALLRQDFKEYIPFYLQIMIAVLFVFFGIKILEKLPIYFVVFGLCLLVFGYLFFCKGMYKVGYILDVFYVPLCLCLGFMVIACKKYLGVTLDRIRVVDTFKRYLEPKIVDRLIQMDPQMTHLGGVNTEISCLFVDIRGFTAMSEQLSPTEVVEILNEYFELVTQCIFRYQGTVDKFIGDAAMATFNTPLPLEDYVYRSVCTGWDIMQGCEELSKKCEAEYGQKLQFGIGIHCGNAIVGNIGTLNRMDYTAIGNTVNTAARLESIARPGEILISHDVYEEIKDRIEVESMGKILLKGKQEDLRVYSVKKLKDS